MSNEDFRKRLQARPGILRADKQSQEEQQRLEEQRKAREKREYEQACQLRRNQVDEIVMKGLLKLEVVLGMSNSIEELSRAMHCPNERFIGQPSGDHDGSFSGVELRYKLLFGRRKGRVRWAEWTYSGGLSGTSIPRFGISDPDFLTDCVSVKVKCCYTDNSWIDPSFESKFRVDVNFGIQMWDLKEKARFRGDIYRMNPLSGGLPDLTLISPKYQNFDILRKPFQDRISDLYDIYLKMMGRV